MANNSSSSSVNTLPTPTLHVILNIISLTATSLGTFLSFVILTGLLLRKKTFCDVPLLLCTNNYLIVFFLGIFELMHNVHTLRGDFGLSNTDRNILECRREAYMVFSLSSAVYLACVLQAVFRLCRIVYPTLLWLLSPCTYLIIIPLMWITSFILISPLYLRYGHKLIVGEFICRITKDDTFSIAYATISIHGIPFISIVITYFQVHRFLQRQRSSRHHAFSSRRRRRDIFVFRRIITMVLILGSTGMPNSVMLIILAVTGDLVSSFYRVLELSFSMFVLTLSVALFYVTPQLGKNLRICPRKTKTTKIVVHEKLFVRNRLIKTSSGL